MKDSSANSPASSNARKRPSSSIISSQPASTKRRLPLRYLKARTAARACRSLLPPSHRPDDPGEIIQAALQQALLQAYESGELTSLHPLLLEAADRKRRELNLREQVISATLQKLQAQIAFYRNRDRAIQAELDRHANAGQPLTPSQMQEIRSLFGLADPQEPAPLDDPLLDTNAASD